MAPRALLALLLALAAADGGGALWLQKCCFSHQMLSGDGRDCVDARWPRNASIPFEKGDFVKPPLDVDWVGRWLPPGIPLANISLIECRSLFIKLYNFVMRVNSSSLWNEHSQYSERNFSGRMALKVEDGGRTFLIRPKKGGGHRELRYCVDAAAPPLGPFAVAYSVDCEIYDDCQYKCCWPGEVLIAKDGQWVCERDNRESWTPYKSSYTGYTDPDTPFDLGFECEFWGSLPLTSETYETFFGTADIRYRNFMFASWYAKCIDYQRNDDGSLSEVMQYCEESLITRGVYWLLRPLSFVSALLLAAALLALASNGRMRRTAHGWSVACHAACLLAFNAGQIAFYLLIGDEWMETDLKEMEGICKALGISLYFLLIAAASWLTALCFNMSMHFGELRLVPSSAREVKRKFLRLSLFAWGLPTIMTAACASLVTIHPPVNPKSHEYPKDFIPTLAETRTCYGEINYGTYRISLYETAKSGAALFFYGPVGALVLANAACIWRTARRAQFLKRGNSVLRRAEDVRARAPQRAARAGGESPRSSRETSPARPRAAAGQAVDAKRVQLYMKLFLMTGMTEFFTETLIWSITSTYMIYYPLEHVSLVYRATGYVTDFFKALCVAWMAAPDGGYAAAARERLRGVWRWRRAARGSSGVRSRRKK